MMDIISEPKHRCLFIALDYLTVGVGTDEDPDAPARGNVVRRERGDVAADCSPAECGLARTWQSVAHS